MTSPEVFGEHDDVRTAGLFVRRNKAAPHDWTQPEKSRHFETRLNTQQLLRFAGAAKDFTARTVRADGLEDVASAIAPIHELWK
jgi:hypothetical protein